MQTRQLVSGNKKRVPRERALPKGFPCINCFSVMGLNDSEAVTAEGFLGASHGRCFKQKAMPRIAQRVIALIDSCQKLAKEQHGRVAVLASFALRRSFLDLIEARAFRTIERKEFTALVSDTLTTLHNECSNGLSGKQTEIIVLAKEASRTLFTPVMLNGVAVEVMPPKDIAIATVAEVRAKTILPPGPPNGIERRSSPREAAPPGVRIGVTGHSVGRDNTRAKQKKSIKK